MTINAIWKRRQRGEAQIDKAVTHWKITEYSWQWRDESPVMILLSADDAADACSLFLCRDANERVTIVKQYVVFDDFDITCEQCREHM